MGFDMNRWEHIYNSPTYQDMIAQKTRFIGVSTIFFVAFYFALPVLVGYWPEVMSREVWGVVNWAYLFAFSQFLMAWALAYFYMLRAKRFDETSASILAETADTEEKTADKEGR
jgi:uncharacterized membrane protein (DUF485 family)